MGVDKRNQHEWTTVHALHAIKGKPVNARAFFDWRFFDDSRRRVNSNSIALFEGDLLRRFAQRIIGDHGPGVTIVPVPNGSAAVGVGGSFRTMDLARRIAGASANQLSSADFLRWAKPMGRTHLGERRRDVDDHLHALRIREGAKGRAVLFDDVVTSGSQLCAAKTKLEEAGIDVLGLYAIADVLDEGERGTAPGWRTVTRDLNRMADFFADLEDF